MQQVLAHSHTLIYISIKNFKVYCRFRMAVNFTRAQHLLRYIYVITFTFEQRPRNNYKKHTYNLAIFICLCFCFFYVHSFRFFWFRFSSPLMSAISVKLMTFPWMWLFMKNPFEGAQCAIRLATDPKLKNVSGEYFK